MRPRGFQYNLDHLTLKWLESLTEEEYKYYVDSGHPQIPRHDCMPFVVDYSTRGPNDFVVSGPLGDAVGPGRRFPSLSAALKWAQGKYGDRARLVPELAKLSGELMDTYPLARWAILVKQ